VKENKLDALGGEKGMSTSRAIQQSYVCSQQKFSALSDKSFRHFDSLGQFIP